MEMNFWQLHYLVYDSELLFAIYVDQKDLLFPLELQKVDWCKDQRIILSFNILYYWYLASFSWILR